MRARRATLVAVAAIVIGAIPLGLALAAGTGKLSFVGAKKQGHGGVKGITATDDVAVSNDGKNVYAVGGDANAIATFRRNHDTGKLNFLNARTEGHGGVHGMTGPEDVVVSPDNRSVYVTGNTDDTVVTFRRDHDTGKLKFVNAKRNGHGGVHGIDNPDGLAVSNDGHDVYVTGDASNAIATFKRDRDTGKLKFVNAKFDGHGGIDGMGGADGVALSPNDRSVYVASSNDSALATFKRDPDSGKLTFINAKFDGAGGVDGLGAAYEPVVSGDGHDVYVASYEDDAVATFKRKRSGRLDFVNAKFNSLDTPLNTPYDLVVSGDGRNLYVTAYNDDGTNAGLDTFKRNRDTGKLRFVNAKQDGVGGIHGIKGLWRVTISADDKNLYTADYKANSVGIFKRAR